MCVIVRERAKSVEFFLSGCIPKAEFDMYVVDEYIWMASAVMRRVGIGLNFGNTMDVIF